MVFFEFGKPKHKYTDQDGVKKVWRFEPKILENLVIKEKLELCLHIRKKLLICKNTYWLVMYISSILIIILSLIQYFNISTSIVLGVIWCISLTVIVLAPLWYTEEKRAIFKVLERSVFFKDFLNIARSVVSKEWFEKNISLKHMHSDGLIWTREPILKWFYDILPLPNISWFPRNFAKAMNELIYLVANEIYLENPSEELPNWRIYRRRHK